MRAFTIIVATILATTLLQGSVLAAGDEPVIPPDDLVYCTVCHGVQLKGNHVIQAPRLSGMQGWYVQRQLFAFRRGWRGTHEQDVYGMEMEPMAPAAPEAIREAVNFVRATRSDPPPATIEGDVDRGRELYGPCAACHAADGSGERDLGGPALTVANDWYLVRQLENFRAGIRGSHPDDASGAQMRAAALVLPDDQAIRDVVAYINSLQPR